MATTIYGCINFSTGAITFENLETCLEQSACLVVSGEYAGQVALTLSGADDEDCNDTFYGGVNVTTGKFQVIIPENCCEAEEYIWTPGDNCPLCTAEETPKCITVKLSGLTFCGAVGYCYYTLELENFSLNGYHILEQSYVSDQYCEWKRSYPNVIKWYSWYLDENYICKPYKSGISSLGLTVQKYLGVSDIYTFVYVGGTIDGQTMYAFYRDWMTGGWTKCIEFAIPLANGVTQCYMCLGEDFHCIAHSGTAQIIEGEYQPPSWIVDNFYSTSSIVIGTDNKFYGCHVAHTSTYDDKPITGENWATYWFLVPRCS